MRPVTRHGSPIRAGPWRDSGRLVRPCPRALSRRGRVRSQTIGAGVLAERKRELGVFAAALSAAWQARGVIVFGGRRDESDRFGVGARRGRGRYDWGGRGLLLGVVVHARRKARVISRRAVGWRR